MKEKKIIGKTEIVDLPQLGLYNVEAKIDTGADSSVVHCENFEIVEKDGHRYVVGKIATDQEHENLQDICFPIHRERTVKSSFGQSETRFIFATKIIMFGTTYDIKLSFRNRKDMTYPMLLGRNFISGKFLVDVSKQNLSVVTHKN